MPSFIQTLEAAQRPLLWLDDAEYCAALLAGGRAPWLDATAFVAWRRKSQSLLKTDVVALPVAPICAAWLDRDAPLLAAMAARSRVNFPLKTLLASAALREHLTALLTGLRSSFPAHPLALVCPSPRAWVAAAYRCALGPGSPIEVGEDEVDAATVHCADFLREFALLGVDSVLLEESQDDEPRDAGELEWYRAVLNVGGHYRWDMGLLLPGARFQGGLGSAAAGAQSGGFSFVIIPDAEASTPHEAAGADVSLSAGACVGRILNADFWRGAAPESLPPARFHFAHIPVGVPPEVVLDRLALWTPA
jgi:hypothetical protein